MVPFCFRGPDDRSCSRLLLRPRSRYERASHHSELFVFGRRWHDVECPHASSGPPVQSRLGKRYKPAELGGLHSVGVTTRNLLRRLCCDTPAILYRWTAFHFPADP